MTGHAAIEVEGLRKSYGEREAVRGVSFSRRRTARCSVSWARTAPARRPRWRSSRATGSAPRGARRVLGMDPGDAAAGAARARRHRAAVERSVPPPDGARGGGALGRALPGAARRRRDDRARSGLTESAERAHERAVGRPAAAAGLRARARRRPRARVPRRADHGLRPGGPPAGVGHRALAAGARQDRAPHHPLPRRGAGARRPRGDHQGRRDPRRGRAARPRRGRGALSRELARPRRASCRSARRTTRRRCCTS